MSAEVVDGRDIARDIEAGVRRRVENLGITPELAVITPGREEGIEIYLRQIRSAARRCGIVLRRIDCDADEEGVIRAISSADAEGIMLARPLPPGLELSRLIEHIPPDRDVEGIHPVNLGALLAGEPPVTPCTAQAVMEIVDRAGIKLQGTEAVIVNHSPTVGKPLALMMLLRNATVSVCHIFTSDLGLHTRRAEVLVVGAGVPGLITRDMVRSGAAVIDVGMNRVEGRICGDVDFDEVREVAGVITPVPGGVGPVTVACLMRNLVRLCSEP
jgi:methylenetetrahydrofolate dehydrogenase (NADP+)/methenyltetrahydrofolate cyclohydrolase